MNFDRYHLIHVLSSISITHSYINLSTLFYLLICIIRVVRVFLFIENIFPQMSPTGRKDPDVCCKRDKNKNLPKPFFTLKLGHHLYVNSVDSSANTHCNGASYRTFQRHLPGLY